MLTGIEIHNYRGIRQGQVEGLGAINLLVGPNGSGKSTLLEGVFLGTSGNPNFIFQGYHGTVSQPLISLRHNEYGFPTEGLWFRKETAQKISIGYRIDDNVDTLVIEQQRGLNWEKGPLAAHLPFYRGMRLLDIRMLLDSGMEQQSWDQLLNIRADRDLVKVMNQVYRLNLESFSYSVSSRTLRVLFTDRDFALGIDDLGAGMRIAFRLFISILLTKQSAVLVEEFDGYQHAESLPRFVQALFALSSRAQSQLFLATHSLETVKAFVDQAQQGTKVDLKVFQTALTPDGSFKASCLSSSEAKTLVTGGIDIRRTA